MILTPAQFQEHVSTSLGAEALQRLLDAAETAIVARIGLPTPVNELITSHGELLMLSRPAESVTTVIEGTTTLAVDDYQLRSSGMILRRLSTGTNRATCWRGRIDVTYVPLDDAAERERVQIALVQLDLNYDPGSTGETIGAWSEQQSQTGETYDAERESILGSLAPAASGIW